MSILAVSLLRSQNNNIQIHVNSYASIWDSHNKVGNSPVTTCSLPSRSILWLIWYLWIKKLANNPEFLPNIDHNNSYLLEHTLDYLTLASLSNNWQPLMLSAILNFQSWLWRTRCSSNNNDLAILYTITHN